MINKPKLSVEKQVEHMINQGIKFNLMTQEEAVEYLTNNTYYFKIKAYAKNYQKNKEGKYVNLEFAYLKELAVLDMILRKIVLSMCLHVEHYLKVDLNRLVCSNDQEDGYAIVDEFKNSDFYLKDGGFKEKPKLHYNEDLIEKYKEQYAIWNFVEIISFGELVELHKFYCLKYSVNRGKLHSFLFSVKQLRNACAHSNCLLNNLNKTTLQQNKDLRTFLSNYVKLSASTVGTKANKTLVVDLVYLLGCFYNVVTSPMVKQKINEELDEFVQRMSRNKLYFKTNDSVLSMLNFIETIIKFFSKADEKSMSFFNK